MLEKNGLCRVQWIKELTLYDIVDSLFVTWIFRRNGFMQINKVEIYWGKFLSSWREREGERNTRCMRMQCVVSVESALQMMLQSDTYRWMYVLTIRVWRLQLHTPNFARSVRNSKSSSSLVSCGRYKRSERCFWSIPQLRFWNIFLLNILTNSLAVCELK